MTTEDGGFVFQIEEFVLYAVHFGFETAAWKVGSAYAPLE